MERVKRLYTNPLIPSLFAGIILLALTVSQAMSQPLLTISGDVKAGNTQTVWELSKDELRSLPKTTILTDTIWTEGTQTFEGVSLKTLLEHVGAQDGMLKASAINDYVVTIPTSDAVEGGPIVAYLRNGKEMSLRDKGPLWIVYPYATNQEYNSEEFFSRSIWQLDRIEVVADE